MNREIMLAVLKQSIPVLIVAMLLGIAAGQILNLSESLILVPWVLFMIPIINGIGGNLGSVVGARLASALHMGSISTKLEGVELERNIMTGLALGITTYLSLALFSIALAPALGLEINVEIWRFAAVMMLAGVLLTFVVLATSMVSALYSFKLGLDPDNVVAPLTASSGDIAGILCLIMSLTVVGI